MSQIEPLEMKLQSVRRKPHRMRLKAQQPLVALTTRQQNVPRQETQREDGVSEIRRASASDEAASVSLMNMGFGSPRRRMASEAERKHF